MRPPTRNSARRPGGALAACPWLLPALLFAAAGTAAAENGAGADKPTVRKSQEQLHFELPPDWPIEKRGGMVGPIPVEEYLAMKFTSLDSRLQAMEQKLSGMDLRLRVIEENQKAKTAQPGLRSTGTAQP
jgi:hypothetical protein